MYNIYQTSDMVKHYSKNDSYFFPISAPPIYTYSENGQTRDFCLYGRNDSDQTFSHLAISIYDRGTYDVTYWYKLSLTQAGLDTAPGGNSLNFHNVTPGTTHVFWLRIEVPDGAIPGRYEKIKLRIDYDRSVYLSTFTVDGIVVNP